MEEAIMTWHFDDAKKETYWWHFRKLNSYHPVGMTKKRLDKIKPVLWNDEDFWYDILIRHAGNSASPEEMKEKSLDVYQHCFGNMAGMILQTLVEHGIIKP